MDKFTFNKIAGAVLSALLVIVASRTFVDILYPPGDHEAGTAIQVTQNPVPAEGEQVAEAEKPAEGDAAKPDAPSLSVLLASANPDEGQKSVRSCAACHGWEQGGANKIGPNLYGIVGKDIASVPGFSYSAALQEKEGAWTFEALDAFLLNPKGWAPGTKMAYAGLKDAETRANIIAFLNQQSANPLPLPSADATPGEPKQQQAGGEPAPAADQPSPVQPAPTLAAPVPAEAAPETPQQAQSEPGVSTR